MSSPGAAGGQNATRLCDPCYRVTNATKQVFVMKPLVLEFGASPLLASKNPSHNENAFHNETPVYFPQLKFLQKVRE
jgi:hypothetical protein